MNDMEYVRACIDSSSFGPVVAELGVWASERLNKPLELVHAIERHPEPADASDHSGAIGLGAHDELLEVLSEQDAKRSHDDREQGRTMLEALRSRLSQQTSIPVDVRMRWGTLMQTVQHLQSTTELYVIGKRGGNTEHAEHGLGSNLEATIRTLNVPVLMAARNAAPPTKAVYAFDGSAANRTGIDRIAASNLLKDVPIHIVAATAKESALAKQAQAAAERIQGLGFATSWSVEPGHADTVIAQALTEYQANLLVMGAYAHSRFSRLFRKSTTNTLLRQIDASALILRS